MVKYLSLTNVLLKCSMGMLSDGKSKKSFTYLLYGILAFSMLPIMFVIYMMVANMLWMMAQIDQIASGMGLILFACGALIFMFSIFLIPSVFYFSSDSNILLSLPLKPEHIILAKFSVCVVYEYAFAAVILLPAYAAYITFAHPGFLFYISALITFVLIPILPLVLSTILTILVMRFVPLFKNRDRFHMIAGIVTLVLALSFSFGMQSLDPNSTDPQAMLSLLVEGNNSLLNTFTKLLPNISYFARALCENSLTDLSIAILITALSLVILITLGKYLYFKGAIGFGETGSFRKTMSGDELQKSTQQKNKLITYALKELKLLVRTPVYFLNCIGTCVIMPILLILLPMFQSSPEESFDIGSLVHMVTNSSNFLAYLVFMGLGIGFFAGTINMISATAISREGAHIMYMKYIPMSYRDQIHAKTLGGILLGLLTSLFTILPMYFLFPMPFYYYIILFACSCITTVLGNELGIIFDLMHPKLIWEQEAAAVKQNMGAFISMMGGMALCVILFLICFTIDEQYLMLSAIITLLVLLAGSVGSWILAGKYAQKAMKRL